MDVRGPQPLPYVSEDVREDMLRIYPPPPRPRPAPVAPAVQIEALRLTPKLASGWFSRRFQDTKWSYLGSNMLAVTDTTFTRDLRAMMESHFGAPTRTIADEPSADPETAEFIQFQYWFVLNDTIPVNVMDVNGPFERGLVVATDQKYRELLPDLKRALLEPAIKAGERAPYVDYYYLKEQDMWFVTGYDGERFFVEQVARPNLERGRPHLGSVVGQ